jgi:putative spermidine/putrescine transport system permease protein
MTLAFGGAADTEREQFLETTTLAASIASDRNKPRTETRVASIAWLIAPAGLFFLQFFVLPFGVMALLSVLTGNPLQRTDVAFTVRHYARMADDTLYFESLLSTLEIGAITTVAALFLGYPLAHWLARMRSRLGHALLLMAVIAPMLTGIVVRTFAWIAILSDRGVINSSLTGLGLTAAPLPLMYNEFGTIVALVHIYVPFMVLTLAGVIGAIDERLEEAARNLGATPIRAFLEVTLPLSLPGIFAGSLLVFALAISAYVTPYLMGGQQVLTLPMLIYQQVAATFNTAFAGALGVLLLVVSITLVIAYNRVLMHIARREALA